MENFKITDEKENSLFNRKEVKAVFNSNVTPSRLEVIQAIAKKFSTQEENIHLEKIIGKFGSRAFTITANIYKTKQDKDKIENKRKRDIETEKKIQESKEKQEVSKEENSTEDKSKELSEIKPQEKESPKSKE
ncbi:MAG: hypothetical protein P8X70_03450 [Nanoarchaeota archaeon]